MTAIRASYRGLSLLAELNWDRGLHGLAVCLALVAGSVLGQFFL